MAVHSTVNVCVCLCASVFVTDRRLKDDCVFRRQSRFFRCLWKDQGEVKRGCWIDGGEMKGRFWACERMLMELMELRKPISSAWCPSWPGSITANLAMSLVIILSVHTLIYNMSYDSHVTDKEDSLSRMVTHHQKKKNKLCHAGRARREAEGKWVLTFMTT